VLGITIFPVAGIAKIVLMEAHSELSISTALLTAALHKQHSTYQMFSGTNTGCYKRKLYLILTTTKKII